MRIWYRSTRGVLAVWTVATVFAFAAPAQTQWQAGTDAANGSENVVKRWARPGVGPHGDSIPQVHN